MSNVLGNINITQNINIVQAESQKDILNTSLTDMLNNELTKIDHDKAAKRRRFANADSMTSKIFADGKIDLGDGARIY